VTPACVACLWSPVGFGLRDLKVPMLSQLLVFLPLMYKLDNFETG
jgi:hypothetical protein